MRLSERERKGKGNKTTRPNKKSCNVDFVTWFGFLCNSFAQAQESKIFFSLVLALILAFALRQVKKKYRPGITQAQDYLPHVVMFGQ